MGTKKIHCQKEFEEDIKLPFETMLNKWHLDNYSTSKHLPILYGLAVGMGTTVMAEIGFGRSTFVLAEAAAKTKSQYLVCDRYDYSRYLAESNIEFIKGYADKLYAIIGTRGIGFMFIDYLSSRKTSAQQCYKELKKAYKYIKQNGIICIHDTIGEKYNAAEGVRLLAKKYRFEQITLPFGFGLTIIKKKDASKYGVITPVSIKKRDTD